MKKLHVHALWDAEAGVWAVVESDVPGLATEAPTVDELYAKLCVMIPELMECNPQAERPVLEIRADRELCAA